MIISVVSLVQQTKQGLMDQDKRWENEIGAAPELHEPLISESRKTHLKTMNRQPIDTNLVTIWNRFNNNLLATKKISKKSLLLSYKLLINNYINIIKFIII